jgi:hypothetical protein
MILRSTYSDAQVRLQAMHTLSILTAPDRCRAILAAPSMAATLPLLGAVVSSSKALRATAGWKLESLGVAMKLLTVIASNVFQLVGELSSSRGSVVTSNLTHKQRQQQRAMDIKEQKKSHLQQQGQQEEQGQGRQHGIQQEQMQKEQVEQKQQQEEPDTIAPLSHQAQLDGLAWVGWHCLHNVCDITTPLTKLLSWVSNDMLTGVGGGDREGCEGEVAAGDSGELTTAGETEGREACPDLAAPAAAEVEGWFAKGKAVPPPTAAETAGKPAVPMADALLAAKAGAPLAAGEAAEGAVAESLAAAQAAVAESSAAAESGVVAAIAGSAVPPAPAVVGEGAPAYTHGCFHIESSSVMDRCLSLLEDPLYAGGMRGVQIALRHAGVQAWRHDNIDPKCLLWLLQELSSSGSAAGAGAAFREDGADIVRLAEAGAAVGTAVGAAAGTAAGAEEQAAAAAAVNSGVLTLNSLLCAAIPAVLQDILATAALGIDIEVALPKGRWWDCDTFEDESPRAQFAEARHALMACLKDGGRMMVHEGRITTAALQELVNELLTHVSSLASSGLGRPVGFSCNNPGCGNMQSLSEMGLVGPGVKGAGVCGGCKAACYCDRGCQWGHATAHFCESFFTPQQEEDKAQEHQRQQQEEAQQQD